MNVLDIAQVDIILTTVNRYSSLIIAVLTFFLVYFNLKYLKVIEKDRRRRRIREAAEILYQLWIDLRRESVYLEFQNYILHIIPVDNKIEVTLNVGYCNPFSGPKLRSILARRFGAFIPSLIFPQEKVSSNLQQELKDLSKEYDKLVKDLQASIEQFVKSVPEDFRSYCYRVVADYYSITEKTVFTEVFFYWILKEVIQEKLYLWYWYLEWGIPITEDMAKENKEFIKFWIENGNKIISKAKEYEELRKYFDQIKDIRRNLIQVIKEISKKIEQILNKWSETYELAPSEFIKKIEI